VSVRARAQRVLKLLWQARGEAARQPCMHRDAMAAARGGVIGMKAGRGRRREAASGSRKALKKGARRGTEAEACSSKGIKQLVEAGIQSRGWEVRYGRCSARGIAGGSYRPQVIPHKAVCCGMAAGRHASSCLLLPTVHVALLLGLPCPAL